MLPDFPSLKEKLSKFLMARMKAVHAKHAAPLGDLPFVHIQEGNTVMMIRADGTIEEAPMKHHRVTIQLSTKELETLSTEDVYRKFDAAAKEMAMKTGATFLDSLNKAVSDAGNVVKYKGNITANDLFAMWEMVDIDFDDDGMPQMPTLAGGKKFTEDMKALLNELENDLSARKRFAALMLKKKEQWRDREASRQLVG